MSQPDEFTVIAEKLARPHCNCPIGSPDGTGENLLPCTCGRDAEVLAIAEALRKEREKGELIGMINLTTEVLSKVEPGIAIMRQAVVDAHGHLEAMNA